MQQAKRNLKYLFICGCTMSGMGKGTTISAIGSLLTNQNYTVTAIKIDPYLNIDAGTMSPFEHGEVFVLDDGGEVDLDLGNYERALNINLKRAHNITSGKVYRSILDDEREGNFLGKTIQMIPHVSDRIKQMIESAAESFEDKKGRKSNICLVEIGGTVGDLESGIFFEAIRQFIHEKGSQNCAIIMLSYVPIIGGMNEPKTKLTQHGIKDLKSLGLFPNFIICRSEKELEKDTLKKIAYWANLDQDCVFSAFNVESMCDVPLILNKQNIERKLLSYFNLGYPEVDIGYFNLLSKAYKNIKNSKELRVVNIYVCGKYCSNNDTYYSVIKALEDAACMASVKLNLELIETSVLETENMNEELKHIHSKLQNAHGVIVPGGFGVRGIEGKIRIVKFCRENKIPFLGLCLGMQVAVIEFCRNVLNIQKATSKEFDENAEHPVITTMGDVSYVSLGGTLRLGIKEAIISNKESLSYKIYGQQSIFERHRHRFEVNNDYVEEMEKAGLIFSGRSSDLSRMDMVELRDHPFFYGLQSHPEFKTRSDFPSLPFYAFMLHASKNQDKFEKYVIERSETDRELEDYYHHYFMRQLSKAAGKGKI